MYVSEKVNTGDLGQLSRAYQGSSRQSALIAVHPQYGIGRGCGEDEIIRAAEDAYFAVALEQPESGELYGGEDLYEVVLRDEDNGHLPQEKVDWLERVRENETDACAWKIGGIYGCECVANVAETDIDGLVDADITVDQEFEKNPENYIVGDKLDGAYAGHIRSYMSKFRNPEKASQYVLLGDERAADVVETLEGASTLTRGEEIETDVSVGFDARVGESRPFVELS